MLRQRLQVTYFIVANTLILLLVIQMATHAALLFYERTLPALTARGMSEAARRNYAHKTAADRDELLRAGPKVRFRYEPVVGYLRQETASRFISIDAFGTARGIRSAPSSHGRWPSARRCAGSTTSSVGRWCSLLPDCTAVTTTPRFSKALTPRNCARYSLTWKPRGGRLVRSSSPTYWTTTIATPSSMMCTTVPTPAG